MFEKLKRKVLRKKLVKKKLDLWLQIKDIEKKIKALDDLDKKEKDK